jgi:xylitol oxidase
MSPAYERDSVAIHFTWKPDWPAVRELLPHIESRLEPFHARPHWAKLFTMHPQRVQSLYPRLRNFQQLLTSYDPSGKFRNPYLDQYIFGA